MKPLRDNIVIEHVAEPDRNVGGIYVPLAGNCANQQFRTATVLEAGPDVKKAKKGTTVYVSELAGDKVEGCSLIRERDIVCVVDGSGNAEMVDDRVIVEPIEDDVKQIGDIYLPEVAKDRTKSLRAKVVAVCDGLKDALFPGGIVYVTKKVGLSVPWQGRKCLLIQEKDVECLVTQE